MPYVQQYWTLGQTLTKVPKPWSLFPWPFVAAENLGQVSLGQMTPWPSVYLPSHSLRNLDGQCTCHQERSWWWLGWFAHWISVDFEAAVDTQFASIALSLFSRLYKSQQRSVFRNLRPGPHHHRHDPVFCPDQPRRLQINSRHWSSRGRIVSLRHGAHFSDRRDDTG